MDIVVEDAHLLAGLEGGQADVRAAVAAEGVAEGAVAAGADLALDGEVDLGEVICVELDGRGGGGCEGCVGGGAGGGVFSGDALCEAAGAIFAGAAAFSGLGGAFGGCIKRVG